MKFPLIINIEGNIGTGKSTILQKLQDELEIHHKNKVLFLKEPVDKWDTIKDSEDTTILKHFYQDSEKYAFPFQIMACCTRIANLKNAINDNPDCKIIICERSIEADANIFAKMLYDDGVMNEMEYKIYNLFYDEHKDLYQPTGYVYLDTTADVCLNRIKKRSRDGESNIALEYLQRCQTYHDVWLKNKDLETPVLILDTNKDVNYDNDEGDVWITNISDFITEQLNKHTYFNAANNKYENIEKSSHSYGLTIPFP
jgi:deoxyadenosine/deoxycytidine kinase